MKTYEVKGKISSKGKRNKVVTLKLSAHNKQEVFNYPEEHGFSSVISMKEVT